MNYLGLLRLYERGSCVRLYVRRSRIGSDVSECILHDDMHISRKQTLTDQSAPGLSRECKILRREHTLEVSVGFYWRESDTSLFARRRALG